MNLLTLFSRARQNLSLTPSERALLKLIQGAIITGLVAVATQVQALAQSGHLDFNTNTLLILAGAGVSAIATAAHKLSSASGDPLLSAVVGAFESEALKLLPGLAALPLHQQAAPTAPVAPVAAPAPAADPTASAT